MATIESTSYSAPDSMTRFQRAHDRTELYNASDAIKAALDCGRLTRRIDQSIARARAEEDQICSLNIAASVDTHILVSLLGSREYAAARDAFRADDPKDDHWEVGDDKGEDDEDRYGDCDAALRRFGALMYRGGQLADRSLMTADLTCDDVDAAEQLIAQGLAKLAAKEDKDSNSQDFGIIPCMTAFEYMPKYQEFSQLLQAAYPGDARFRLDHGGAEVNLGEFDSHLRSLLAEVFLAGLLASRTFKLPTSAEGD